MEEKPKIMLNNTKPTTIKAGRPAALRHARGATALRWLQARRGLSTNVREDSRPAPRPVLADRIGTALIFLLSVGLVSVGALMIAQIWANQAMIR
jgi:hypothetical protein